jgi:hypothetical protein
MSKGRLAENNSREGCSKKSPVKNSEAIDPSL